jgi:hypothetical protein
MQRMLDDVQASTKLTRSFREWFRPVKRRNKFRATVLSPGCWPSTTIALRSAHTNSAEFAQQSFKHTVNMPIEIEATWCAFKEYYKSLFPGRVIFPLLHLV